MNRRNILDIAAITLVVPCAGTAHKQGARHWELRVVMSIASLRRDEGKRTEARDLLAPIYGCFTEGFDTRDLKEAAALLADLTS